MTPCGPQPHTVFSDLNITSACILRNVGCLLCRLQSRFSVSTIRFSLLPLHVFPASLNTEKGRGESWTL